MGWGIIHLLYLIPGYFLSVAIYRLLLSRISHIPGPKLAAITYLYHAWYELWPHQGRFLFHLEELHDIYGPVIRIGPDEIHIKDNAFMNEVYPQDARRRRHKSTLFFWMVGTNAFGDHSAGATMDHELHRSRRAALSPYFSGRMVQDLETRVRSRIETMRGKMMALAGTGEILELRNAMSGLTLDVISDYLFGQSFGALDSPDFGRPLNNILLSGVKVHPFARIFRPLAIAMFRAPKWMMPKSDILESSVKYEKMIGDMTRSAFRDAEKMSVYENEKAAPGTRTIVHSQLYNDTLDAADKTFERIKSEGMVLVGAGTETTARTLATAIYHILANDAVHKNVLGEIRTVIPFSESPLPSVAQLQQLPYLTAVVSESLRIAHGVAGRLSRIAPDEDLHYGGLKIPRGVTFSQSLYYVHSDPKVYPEPHEFHPERFLGENSDAAKANLWPFGKGTRSCLGINLAHAELFLTIAMVIGGVDMELVGTTMRDVLPVKEYFVGHLPDDSLGIRVKIRGRASR